MCLTKYTLYRLKKGEKTYEVGLIVALVLLALGVHIALGAVGLFGCIAILGFNAGVWQSTSLI